MLSIWAKWTYLGQAEQTNNWKDSYFIVYERPLQDQNPPDTSVKLIASPLNCKTPPVKEKSPSKNKIFNGTDSYLNKEYLNISGEYEITTAISPRSSTESNSRYKNNRKFTHSISSFAISCWTAAPYY